MASMTASTTAGEVMEPGMKRSHPRLTLSAMSDPRGTAARQSASSSASRSAAAMSSRTLTTETDALGRVLMVGWLERRQYAAARATVKEAAPRGRPLEQVAVFRARAVGCDAQSPHDAGSL